MCWQPVPSHIGYLHFSGYVNNFSVFDGTLSGVSLFGGQKTYSLALTASSINSTFLFCRAFSCEL